MVLDRLRLALAVVDHELGEDLGNLLGDEAKLERRIGVGRGVLLVAERYRSQLEESLGERAEVLDVLLEVPRGGGRAELAS